MSRAPCFALLSLAACARSAAPPAGPADGRVGVHGMVVFGHGPVYVSHIPAFSPPHDAQLVLEVDVAAPVARDEGLYTIQPRPFSLDALRAGRLARFEGDLYRGNFESGGEVVARGVVVTPRRVVVDTTLAPVGDATTAEYLMLGTRAEPFLVHLLRSKADVDRIARARTPPPALPELDDAALRTGATVTLGAGVEIERELSCLVPPDYAEPCARP